MSETNKAGVVTNLWRAVDELDREALDGLQHHQEERLVRAAGAFMSGDILDILDLVASWPPELREVVPLVEALTPEGKALLPDVLRGLSVKGMAAQVEAQVGAVSTSAKVAAWAGGLSEDDLLVVKNALLRPGTGDESQAAQELGHQLRVILEEAQPLDANAARIHASRTPRGMKGPGRMPEDA